MKTGSDSTLDLQELLSRVADKPVPLARLAQLFLARGQSARARELCAQANALAPDNAEVQVICAEILSYKVAGWYFPMVRDHARNRAVEAALRRAIRPGCSVLDIGTGTGLFAMMAARAGAQNVITCEKDPVVAATAAEIIAANNLADRVRVVAKSSFDLQVGIDIPELADLLICDALTSNMIGTGVLPIVEHAKRHLLRPGAAVIPARGKIRVALAEDLNFDFRQMHIIEGFDLSPFNRLSAPFYLISAEDERLLLRSEPADLFHFDFQSGGPFPEMEGSVSLSTSGGLVNGVVQMQSLELDADISYDNVPAKGRTSVLGVVFHALSRPVELEPGSELVISARHDRFSFRIWADV